MVSLVKINSDIIYKKAVPVLDEYRGIVGAVHFGSSLNKCRPDSDIDIGLIYNTSIVQEEREYNGITDKILGKLSPINKHTFDVVTLNTLSIIMAFRIIKEGYIFYQYDTEVVTDFIEQVSRRYADVYPRYRYALQLVAGV